MKSLTLLSLFKSNLSGYKVFFIRSLFSFETNHVLFVRTIPPEVAALKVNALYLYGNKLVG